MLLTKMFTCTAASPTVAGAMSRPIWRSPGSAGRPVGPETKAQPPQRRPLDQELREPAGERAARPAQDHLLDAQAHAPERARPHDGDDVEERRRQCRDAEASLGVQHPHRDRGERDERQERHHHAREAHGELGLAGRVVEARSDPRDERPGQQDAENDHEAQYHGQEGQHAVGELEAGLRPAFLADAGVGGHEGRGERPLGEQVPQQVRDAEGDPEGVRVVARAEKRREHLLADEAEQARHERHRRHDARRPRDVRRFGPRLDLHVLHR